MMKRRIILAAVLLLALSLPLHAFAASTARLSNTVKANVDKLAAASSPSLQARLNAQKSQILALESQDESADQELASLHAGNAELLDSISTRLKQLDAGRLDKLKGQVQEAKDRHKPLFALQTALNKQLTAARKLKNKPLTEALQAQADAVRVTAQLARTEIRMKEDAYSQAKEAKEAAVKKVRNVLAKADSDQAGIRTEKKAAVEIGKQLGSESKNLTAALKKKDAAETLTVLTAQLTLSQQLLNRKTRLASHEKSIRTILQQASALLPAA